jgi:hypothetical protein
MRVYSFSVGPHAESDRALLRELARRTDGRFGVVQEASVARTVLPYVSIAGLQAVELKNLTTGAGGRATRVFPDGSFDGYVPLELGSNVIRVTAQMDDGRKIERERTVVYSRPEITTDAERRASQVLLEEFRARTIEIELAAHTRSHLLTRKQLEIVLEEP